MALLVLFQGIGGAIADWFAYSQTVAVSKKSPDKNEVPVGKGNVRGVIGCEGAHNAPKRQLLMFLLFYLVSGCNLLKLLLWVY